ncbi:hypothetical protein F2P81_006607 [Scophthalmus maximus]|uniref:Uncharacterized protein n=1 Tax=Scophthalmus maximus TaxID=52904 RepID=A0A6A4T787_SCOMX|nr:hypothetical protein F2P81_006607 [Scophthalmus maximus]
MGNPQLWTRNKTKSQRGKRRDEQSQRHVLRSAFMCQLGRTRANESTASRGFLTTFGSCDAKCEIVAMADRCTCVDSSV